MALAFPRDQWAPKAVEAWKAMAGRVLLATSDYVLDETLTLLRRRAGHHAAIEVGRRIQSPEVSLIPVGDETRSRAFALFERSADKPLSFTDCTTLALLEETGIPELFTFDSDFAGMGPFRVIP